MCRVYTVLVSSACWIVQLVMKEFIPALGSLKGFIQDFINKKYPIVAECNERLHGCEPYAQGVDSVARKIAFSSSLLQISSQPFNLVLGSEVREEFVNRCGDIVNAETKKIGGMQSHTYHIRHPDHTYRQVQVEHLISLSHELHSSADQIRKTAPAMPRSCCPL